MANAKIINSAFIPCLEVADSHVFENRMNAHLFLMNVSKTIPQKGNSMFIIFIVKNIGTLKKIRNRGGRKGNL